MTKSSTAPIHKPEIAILTCADARLLPHTFPGTEDKQLFIVRVAGNIAETNAVASIEYAVAELKTKEIWVIGHENCGAVEAACKFNQGETGYLPSELTPSLVHLLADILPVMEGKSTCAGTELTALVQANAIANAERVLQQSKAIREGVESRDLLLKIGYYQWDGTIVWLGEA